MSITHASEAIKSITNPEVVKTSNNTSYLLIGIAVGVFTLLSVALLHASYKWIKHEFESFALKLMNANEENNRRSQNIIADLISNSIPKSKISTSSNDTLATPV